MNTKNQNSFDPTGPVAKDEAAYAQAYIELKDAGTVRAGLLAKALADSRGDRAVAEALYLRWRSAQILDQTEQVIPRTPEDGADEAAVPAVEEKRDEEAAGSGNAFIGFALIMIAVLIGALISVSGGDAGSSVTASHPQQSALPGSGLEANAGNPRPAQAASTASGRQDFRLLLDAIQGPSALEAAASKYSSKPWSQCVMQLAKENIGCRYSGPNSRETCSRDRVMLNASELREEVTPYGREFTLHMTGANEEGRKFGGNYRCHVGRDGQVLALSGVEL